MRQKSKLGDIGVSVQGTMQLLNVMLTERVYSLSTIHMIDNLHRRKAKVQFQNFVFQFKGDKMIEAGHNKIREHVFRSMAYATLYPDKGA